MITAFCLTFVTMIFKFDLLAITILVSFVMSGNCANTSHLLDGALAVILLLHRKSRTKGWGRTPITRFKCFYSHAPFGVWEAETTPAFFTFRFHFVLFCLHYYYYYLWSRRFFPLYLKGISLGILEVFST